jgi:DNA-binding Lrp family transcriptional regulator
MHRLDGLDLAILDELRRDGRLANSVLAQRIGLTPAPCLRRVRRLEDIGIITGYRAVVDPAAVGRGCEVMIEVDITANDAHTVAAFENAVVELDEVTEFRRLLGRPDYLIRVNVSDIAAYEEFLSQRLGRVPGLKSIESHQTMKLVKGEM